MFPTTTVNYGKYICFQQLMDAVCKEERSIQDNRISPFAKPAESPLTLELMNNKTCKALRNLELPVHTGKLESPDNQTSSNDLICFQV